MSDTPSAQHAHRREFWIDVPNASAFSAYSTRPVGEVYTQQVYDDLKHVREVLPGEVTITDQLALELINFLDQINGHVKDNLLDARIDEMTAQLKASRALVPEGTAQSETQEGKR